MRQGRTSSLEPFARAPERAMPTTTELLASGYQRWFEPLYVYVSRYVAGPQVRERIVREVLATNLDLLIGRRDEALELRRLEATADRLIAEAVSEAEQFLDRRREERLSRRRSS